jgi:hypothetical protein
MINKIFAKIDELNSDIDANQKDDFATLSHILAQLCKLESRLHQGIITTSMQKMHDKLITSNVEEARKLNRKYNQTGSIRVGRIAGRFEKGVKFPVTDGYINIVVASVNKTQIGSMLTPFVLKDTQDRIMENIWQFSKVYPSIGQQSAKSKNQWYWPAVQHTSAEGDILPDYWKWRDAGMHHRQAVRSPVASVERCKCLYSLWPSDCLGKNIATYEITSSNKSDTMSKLSYIEARIQVYCPLYILLAKRTGDFIVLQHLLREGYNIQLLDPDGPRLICPDQSPYNYMTNGEYGESGVGSIPINEEIINDLLDDIMQPFCHSYALATALLKKEEWIYDHNLRLD